MNPNAINLFLGVLRRHLPDWLMEWIELAVGAGIFAEVMNIHFGKEVFSKEDQEQLGVILGNPNVPENAAVYGWMSRLTPYPTQHFMRSMLDLARPSRQGLVDQTSFGYLQARTRVKQISEASPDLSAAGDDARTNAAIALQLIKHPATYLGVKMREVLHREIGGRVSRGPGIFSRMWANLRGKMTPTPTPAQPPAANPSVAGLQPSSVAGATVTPIPENPVQSWVTKIVIVLAIIAVVVAILIILVVWMGYTMVSTATEGNVRSTIWLAVWVNILLAIFKRSAKIEDAKYFIAAITGAQVATLICVAASYLFNIGGKL